MDALKFCKNNLYNNNGHMGQSVFITALLLLLMTMIDSAKCSDSSWSAYMEPPCCGTGAGHHKIRHHRDHVREFSCGNPPHPLYYRTMHLDISRDTLYVGAMDRLYRLNLTDIRQSHCERDSLSLEPSNVAQCVSKGKSEDFECRNHIRVIQPVGDGHRLYVCGTNAHSPKDWILYLNLTHLPRHEYVPGVGMGIAKCPYDPTDNSTAIWVSHGNPDELPALYAGTNAEFTQADPVIFRTDLYELSTGQKKFSYKRTLKYDSKWLDKTNFVGSFDSGDYVFMFFRETAVEYMNCGKAVYSRVARICKKDLGGKHILNQNWATYLKARLNCSIPGEFPFYFDEIQSVYQMSDDKSKFYAAFTTGSSDGLVGSAICSYSINNIQEAFAGKFKEQATSSSAWLPVLTNKVPVPRPGTCVNDTTALPDTVLNFIRSHPLMDEAIRQDFDAPIFYKRDLILTQLVVDRRFVDMLGADRHYTVFYAGTNDGQIYKIVQWITPEKTSQWNLADIWRAAPGEPIRNLQISREHASLYVATDMRVLQLPLVICTKKYDSCVRCVLDPYCGWDKDTNICKPYQPGLLQDASNMTTGLCEISIMKKTLTASYGQSLHLSSYLTMPEVFKTQTVTWYHYSKEKGRYKIKFGTNIIQTIENGIVILSISQSDGGRYECFMGPTLIASYNVEVDTHRCTHPNKTHEYKKIYSDWCHEFEKYKSAMKAWEKKQMQCLKSSGKDQNLISNEVSSTLR